MSGPRFPPFLRWGKDLSESQDKDSDNDIGYVVLCVKVVCELEQL